MLKQLSRSVREYKAVSIATPVLVALEVVMECVIPFIIAELVNQIKAGCEMSVLLQDGLLLVLMAMLSLAFGSAVRHDLLDRVLRLCPQSASGHVLCGAELFLREYRPFLDLVAGHTVDHRCHQWCRQLI